MTITLNGTTGITTPDVTADSGESLTSRVAKSGDTMTGDLTLPQANVTTLKHASAGVDNLVLDSSGYTSANGLRISGADKQNTIYQASGDFTMSSDGGNIGIRVNPTNAYFNVRTQGTERMRIDSAGRVTMPYQPAFSGTRDAGSFGVGQTLVCNKVNLNVGNHYNTSNGRFTAPISGVYEFSCFFMGALSSTNTAVAMLFRLNGSQTTARVNPYTRTTGADYVGMAGSCILNLSAGDWVDVTNDGSTDIYGVGSGHNHFTAKLIG